MRTEQQVVDMIKHFEDHANDPKESIEERKKYRIMSEALKKVLD